MYKILFIYITFKYFINIKFNFFVDMFSRYKLSFYLNKGPIQIKRSYIFLKLSDSHSIYKYFLIAKDHSPYHTTQLDYPCHNNSI